MLNYSEFKKDFSDALAETFCYGYSIEYRTIYKVNEKMDTVNIYADGKHDGVHRNIYIKDEYDRFCDGKPLSEIIDEIAKSIISSDFDTSEFESILKSDERIKRCIVPIIINAEKNKEYLEMLPHKDILDLAIVYRAVFSADADHHTGSMVTYDMAKGLGLSGDELHSLAVSNAKNIGIRITEINDIVTLSNNRYTYGAYEGFINDNLRIIADYFDDDLYIIPSSLHEVFMVPCTAYCLDHLKDACQNAISVGVIKPGDWLSNNIYIYNKDDDSITIA